MSELEESEIEVALQSLGFTKNDSKVLLTLCKYKILSPADIAKQSGVDRARVYDSLNRLIEKGFIQSNILTITNVRSFRRVLTILFKIMLVIFI